MRWRYSLASKEYLHRTPSKKAGREIIWGNHSLEAKEWFPQTLSKKTDWVKAGSKKSDCFSASKRGGAHQSVFPSAASIGFLRRLQVNRNNRLVMPPIIDALANFGSYYKSVVQ